MSTVAGGRVGRERVGLSAIIEQSITPAARFRKPHAVLLDDKCLREDVRHIHVEGRLHTLLRFPLQLHDLGAFRERLAIAGNARFEGRVDVSAQTQSALAPGGKPVQGQVAFPACGRVLLAG